MFIDFLTAFFIALIFGALIVALFGRRGPGPLAGFLFFFMLLLLPIWAGGIWVTPFGPTFYGTPWFSFLFIGIVIALLIGAATPPASRRTGAIREEGSEAEAAAEATTMVIGVFFWIFMIALILAITSRYAWG
jgi:hypothetical protein